MNRNIEIGLLITRLVLGIIFLVHGIVKFRDGIGNISGWFDSIGIPGFAAYIVAIIELVGGLALIVGFGTRIVSILLAIVMAGAIFKVKLAAGFLGNGQVAGYELDLALLAIALLLALSGSRLLALDRALPGSRSATLNS
ncbi:DoxX family protein [Paenibacillus oceani]|uniref:DoxX family protein n=1 Tax=Paenibacillus oceani TaxID=2772510 RepID=A0A927H033_9BACL|nr:DoxX family protein [Paenibacillus oceani]MBD2863285.1 DoxX family protein [Paenibacillus oceani]